MYSGVGPCSIINTSLSSVSSSREAKLIVVEKWSTPWGACRRQQHIYTNKHKRLKTVNICVEYIAYNVQTVLFIVYEMCEKSYSVRMKSL